MAQFFILPDGTYFETLTDVGAGDFEDGRVAVDQRPSVSHVREGGSWVEVQPDPLQMLQAERAGMRVFMRAFTDALKLVPAVGYLHLLDKATQIIAAATGADPYNDLKSWRDTVTEVIRMHPDMGALEAAFGVSPLQIDQIFRIAMAIEQIAPAADIQQLVADYGDIS